ncbi:hypothetical protein Lesp02_15240 [Lentzea sp. NBRC 105346]|uniref:phosphopantetheine-binding protein n=1 Tax=Lentzea sp. NBRC 105346 TaxID=3032205 RepID=UPI0024A04CDB|nr:phosphopantetheine-binding protein [Lentzea sp. NBRC 105346]GLZ29334.1 hypothetical protein Lesp02_15240 [Lentzea sp. NBRC 105346]
METQEISSRVGRLIRQVGSKVEGELPSSAEFRDLGLDSMDVVDLLNSVEHEFGIAVPDSGIPVITTVGALVEFVETAL